MRDEDRSATIFKHKVPKHLGGYRLITKLGQGGMAAVFKALQVSMDREVALKVLAPSQAEDHHLRTRFMREARLAGRVQHQHVIACYDSGEANGYLFMAMELAEQGDVLALAQRCGGRLPERLALPLMRDCARGLDAIHRANLLHRDLKPANIFLSATMCAKLADLGVAKDVRRLTDSDQPAQSTIIGTPAYMAPEQARGRRPDFRSDIYALGATFFHLLTSRLPFLGATPQETMNLVMTRPSPDPGALVPHLTAETTRIIRRAMAKVPEDRHRSAAELLDEIETVLDPRPRSLWMDHSQFFPLGYSEELPRTAAALLRCPL